MMSASHASDESARLAALNRYDILDTPAEAEFDDLTQLAAQICGAPIALISLVDAHRQWFKSKVGVEAAETPRDIAFCHHGIQAHGIFEVPDAQADDRFRDNPIVTGDAKVRFYAGAPLTTSDGHNVGMLCVKDTVPRHLSAEQREALARLGRQVVTQMELRLANRNLAEQTAFQKAILASAGSAIIATTPEGVITHFNPAAEQMLGYTAREMISKLTPAVFHDPAEVTAHAPELSAELGREIAPGFEVFVAKARAGETETREWTYVRKDGSRFPVLLSVSALHNATGALTGFLGIARDLTERKEAEEALRQSEAQLRDLFDNCSDLIQSVGPDGRILFVNRAWRETLGYSEADVATLNVFAIVHPDCRAHCGAIFQRLMQGENVGIVDVVLVAKDGRRIELEGNVNVRLENGQPASTRGIFRDITGRKQAEAQLRERTRLAEFQAAVGASLTGPGELRGQLQHCAEAMVKPFDAAFARIWTLNEAEQVLELQASAGLYTHLDGPHGRVPVGKFKIGLIAAERAAHLTNSVIGDPRVGDQEWARREGMVAFAGYPLLVEGRAVGVMAMFARHALTEQHLQAMASVSNNIALAIQRKRAEDSLRAKNDELKGFAYTVSHDLKAPLRGISGYAQELERRHKAGLGERAQFCVTQIITASRNLDCLIEDLLKYSRLDAETPTLSELDLSVLVQRILRDRTHTLTEQGVEQTVNVPPLKMQAWERGVSQVLTNLIDNAIKYSRQSKPPRLAITAEELPEACRVTVADNGIGFDMKYHDRIFGLFNRLVRPNEFEGTGAGLAIVKKVLEKLGGKIRAESAPGQGATFIVELPKTNRPQ